LISSYLLAGTFFDGPDFFHPSWSLTVGHYLDLMTCGRPIQWEITETQFSTRQAGRPVI
jgi:hypothetical protein